MTIELLIEDLSVRRGSRIVVDRANLTVSASSWCGIVGVNGSGKTSLLRAISGRLPIQNGSCQFAGRELSQERKTRAEDCGFNPPNSSLPDQMRLHELLEFVAVSPEAAKEAIGELWDPLGLGQLDHQWIGEMSSGMRQRVSIGLAFARGNSLVLLDEPFNWLDPVAAYEIKQALRAKVVRGLTLVTALHDLTTLCSWCDEGALMSPGKEILPVSRDELNTGKRDTIAFEKAMISRFRASK